MMAMIATLVQARLLVGFRARQEFSRTAVSVIQDSDFGRKEEGKKGLMFQDSGIRSERRGVLPDT
jgi:hypothetical protein